MAIDQFGNHRAPGAIDTPGAAIGQRPDQLIVADGQNSSRLHGHRPRPPILTIQRQHVGIRDYQIGAIFHLLFLCQFMCQHPAIEFAVQSRIFARYGCRQHRVSV